MDLILARHAETVFNAAARMQGHMAHTPLTRSGIAQAEAMGAALRETLGEHIVCPDRRLFRVPPPGGEWFPEIAARLTDWLAGLDMTRPMLVISHGITARVLRGILVGGQDWQGVPVAADAPQGTVFHIRDGAETMLHVGSGVQGVRAA
jgi:broad specificity phosphatase PhoE